MRNATILLSGAVLGAAAVIGVTQSTFLGGGIASAASRDAYKQLLVFGDIYEHIRSDYVEAPDDTKLVESAIDAMLTSLDPHSSYMNPRSYRDMQVQTKGEFGGLGIEVSMENGLVKVNAPNDDGPAAKAGVKAGDLISSVDGTPIQGLTLNQAVEKMRGAVGTPVTITLIRKDVENPIELKVVRDIIPIASVRSREENDIGYIRITQFTEKTYDGLKNAITKIKADIPADKLKGYVIDLRNNPGGLVDQAVKVCDTFLERGEIVSIRGRKPTDVQRYDAQSGDQSDGKPVVILINGAAASASEIVAGAFQDHRRATIVGTRSFGKGSVQTIVPLSQNGGGLRLTTARYYTPAGRSIQAKGIEPDIEIREDIPAELVAAMQSTGEAGLKGHLINATGGDEQQASSAYVPQDPTKDNQLIYAYSLLRGTESNAAFPPDPNKRFRN